MANRTTTGTEKKAKTAPKSQKSVSGKHTTPVGGTLEVGSRFNLSNGNPAPDGRYRFSGHLYHIEKGIITEISDLS